MLDSRITGALVVDGTGRAAQRTDVGISGGRIVAMGEFDEPAARTVDAAGLVLTPGFIDIHTHYDAQLFWDPYCTPSPLHGVTTVIAGNCGLSLAPAPAGDEEYLLGVMARVEAIPQHALEAGVEFRWRTFPEMMAVLEAIPLGVNVGLLAGHVAIRRAVMGAAATERAASASELAAMTAGLCEAIEAGALGFSTSTSRLHLDPENRLTPPCFAEPSEIVDLAAVTRRYPGTTVECIPGSAGDGFSDGDVALLRAMAVASQRAVNWNLLQLSSPDDRLHERQLRASEVTGDLGAGRVIALMMPNNPRFRIDFGPDNIGLRLVDGCGWLFELSESDRLHALTQPEQRAAVRAALHGDGPRTAAVRGSLPDWVLNDGLGEDQLELLGRSVGDIARSRGADPLDVVCDLAVASRGRIGFTRRLHRDAAEVAPLKRRLLRDPRVVLGGSDAGAHLDAMASGEYPTAAISELVNDEQLVGLEELVRLLTDVPARLLGLSDRGRIEPGCAADLVLLDPGSVRPGDLVRRSDLPGGASRLYSAAEGIHEVIVGGQAIVTDGRLTGALPGRLLRSGVDTE